MIVRKIALGAQGAIVGLLWLFAVAASLFTMGAFLLFGYGLLVLVFRAAFGLNLPNPFG